MFYQILYFTCNPIFLFLNHIYVSPFFTSLRKIYLNKFYYLTAISIATYFPLFIASLFFISLGFVHDLSFQFPLVIQPYMFNYG